MQSPCITVRRALYERHKSEPPKDRGTASGRGRVEWAALEELGGSRAIEWRPRHLSVGARLVCRRAAITGLVSSAQVARKSANVSSSS
jgi:hypothetical protein